MKSLNRKQFSYLIVTVAYWAFMLSDGALRMLVLLHFHQNGFSPLQLASLFLFLIKRLSLSKTKVQIKMTIITKAIKINDAKNPNIANKAQPTRNPKPLTAFFEPVNTATHLNNPSLLFGARIFTADLDDILVKSLAIPLKPWTTST